MALLVYCLPVCLRHFPPHYFILQEGEDVLPRLWLKRYAHARTHARAHAHAHAHARTHASLPAPATPPQRGASVPTTTRSQTQPPQGRGRPQCPKSIARSHQAPSVRTRATRVGTQPTRAGGTHSRQIHASQAPSRCTFGCGCGCGGRHAMRECGIHTEAEMQA